MNYEAEQFEFDDELKLIDELLQKALKADTPENLGESVFAASLQEFKLIELDQKLQQALAFEASSELKAKLLRSVTDRQELVDFEARVEAGLRPDAPTGLSDMIYQASCEELQATATHNRLAAALQPNSPMGLADRIFQATSDQLEEKQEQPAVIAKIGMQEDILSWARAACIMMGISIGLWLIVTSLLPSNYNGTDDQYAQTPVEMLLEDDASVIAMEDESFDIGLDDLTAEVAALDTEDMITSLGTSFEDGISETEAIVNEIESWQ